ncbi:MAG: hypothetical protein ACYDHD_00095 [Vulcanimicrobiaceae bacterium]
MPRSFFALRLGDRYGRFHERITRIARLRRDDPAPSWFTPYTREGHLGITVGDQTIYLELAIDEDARYLDHPFSDIQDLSQHIEQISLFGRSYGRPPSGGNAHAL